MTKVIRKRFVAGGTATLGAFGIVHFSGSAAQFEFKCGSVFEPDRPAIVRLMQMFAAIEQESGGRVRGQVFPSNQLGTESAMFTQLRVGAVQFMLIAPGFLASVVPVADLGNIGFVFKDDEEALRAMQGPLGAYIRNDITAKNVYAFRTMYTGGMYQVGCGPGSRPIRSPDDLRGFKIRVNGKIAADLFKELGASPVALNLTEVYTGLQTHLLDGEAAPLVTIDTTRLFEVNKYISLTDHAWSGSYLICNGDVWKSLPPDLQEMFERNQQRYAQIANRETAAIDKTLVAKLRGRGVTINEVNQAPFRARLGNYFQSWASLVGPAAWGLLQSSVGRKLT